MSKPPGEIAKLILSILAAAGLITVALVAPNFIQVFGNLGYGRRYNNRDYERSLLVLRRKKFIKVKKQKGKISIIMTKLGRQKILEDSLRNITISQQKKWDKKWRLVIFDIPERYKKERLKFSKLLRQMGFVMYQKSVWVSPWPCSEEINYIKEVYSINIYVKLITADNIENSYTLIKDFGLA